MPHEPFPPAGAGQPESRHADIPLPSIGTTANKASLEFFRQLVKQLASAMDVAYAFVAEFAGSQERLRTIAHWGNGNWLENFEYDVETHPCGDVVQHGMVFHGDNLQEHYPQGESIRALNARSYLGKQLVASDGQPMGLVAVVDTKPIAGDTRSMSIFELFAEQARVELERTRAQHVLRQTLREFQVDFSEQSIAIDGADRPPELAQDKLAALLEISQALSKHRDREALFGAIAAAIEGLLPAERLIVLVPDSQGAAVSVYAVHGAVKLFEGERIPEDSVAAWVVQQRKPMVVASSEQVRESFPTTHQKLVEEGMQSLVVLPLLVQDRCLGALGFMARAAGVFETCAERLLDEIANSVAVALESCLAYEQLERLGQERKALLEVNAAVGRHLERDELFGAMAVCLRDLVPTERFGIELPIAGNRLQGHLLTPRSAHAEPTRPTVLPAAGTACDWVLQHRQWIVTSSRDELRERFPVTFQVMSEGGMESLCAMPLVSGERCPGVLFFMAARKAAYDGLRRDFIEQVAGAVAVALDDCLAHEEVQQLRDRLAAENVYLREEISQEHNFGEIVGRSAELRQVLSLVETVAPTSSTVLILGETGTGKELIARAIHDRSPRRGRPLVKVNCSAIPSGLVESELFGHIKGAFTGASTDRSGRFALADGGTIFLDEIGELPPETQVKLLRVMQEREFEPVGSNQTRRVDVRVIAATNRDLQQAVAQGRFRSDLYFRVNVLPIRVPALRERREDIPLLVHFFVERFAREMTKRIDGVSKPAMDRLLAYDWPGNVRELQNIIERSMVLTSGPLLELASDFVVASPDHQRGATQASVTMAPSTAGDARTTPPSAELTSLDEVGKHHILQILERCNWVIEGPQGAARLLGLQPSTLRSRLKKLGLQSRSSSPTTSTC